MFHDPGGDWNPGRGDNPMYMIDNDNNKNNDTNNQ